MGEPDTEAVVCEPWQILPGEVVTAELISDRTRMWVEQSPEAAAFRALMDPRGPDWRRARNKRKAARRCER